MARHYFWHLMTWQELREAIKTNPPILIPIGTTETQGASTFVGLEFILPQRLARAVAAQTSALLLPAIPFGFSPHFVGVPGTISLRPEVVSGIYTDIARSLILQGCTRLLFLAMHAPNRNILEQVAYQIREELGVLVAWINPGQLAGAFMRSEAPHHPAKPDHGADPGLSLAMYLEPELASYSGIKPDDARSDFQDLALAGMVPTFRGFPFNVPLKILDVAPTSAGLGDPSHANVELGRAIFEQMVEHTVALVRKFETMETMLVERRSHG